MKDLEKPRWIPTLVDAIYLMSLHNFHDGGKNDTIIEKQGRANLEKFGFRTTEYYTIDSKKANL